MRKAEKFLAQTLTLALTAGLLAGCSGNGSSSKPDTSQNNAASNEESKADTNTGNATYTYTFAEAESPATWNSHDVEVSESITGYTQMTMWEQVLNDTADGLVWVSEMAEGDPEDVTSEYAGNKAWGIPADATAGYAWRVTLNPDACWENGTPINADSYIYSMQQVLNPEMNNYSASYWYTKFPIYNAENYFKSGEGVSMEPVADIETYEFADYGDADLYISFTQATSALWGYSAEEYYNGYEEYYLNEAGEDLLEKYGGEDYIPVTDEVIADINYFLMNFWEEEEISDDNYLYMAFYEKEIPPVTFDDVGFFKTGEYELTIILYSPLSEFYFKYNSDDYALVYEELYEAGKTKTGDMIKTNYGTSADTYMSYGPYKLVSFQADKEWKLTRNENWFGWKDSEYEGLYQATDIVCTIMEDIATKELLFLQGKLDSLLLNSDITSKYQGSDYLVYMTSATVYFLNINNDYDALAARETDGVNKTILTYEDFRKGISLAMNRAEYVAQMGYGAPLYGYFNNNFIWNVDSGETYRSSEVATEVLKSFYGVSDVNEITGYDLETARECLVKGYNQALEDGLVKEDDQFVFEFPTWSNDTASTKQVNFMQNSLDAATAGTALEGRITINMAVSEDYYAMLDSGEYDFCISGWNGDDYDPYSFLQYFVTDTATPQTYLGFDPETETLEIKFDGKTETRTYYDWYDVLCNGEYALLDNEVRNEILAAIELALLEKYRDCPFYSSSNAQLLGIKIAYPTYEPVGGNYLGGIRSMTFNYTDEEWAAYCAENGNQLNYQ